MINTNIKVAFRRLIKQPAFTSINSIGLTLGIVAFLFITQYVTFQQSFNNMYPKAALTYRLLEAVEGDELGDRNAPGIVPRVKENVAGVELASRMMAGIGAGIILVEQEGIAKETFRENELVFVDHDFIELFPTSIIQGQPDLNAPQTLVLTESAALRYFQTTDVINKTVQLINQFGEHPFRITGVISNFPANSDIQAEVLASMSTLGNAAYIASNAWLDINTLNGNFVNSYFKLSHPEVAENVLAYRKSLTTNDEGQKELQVALQSVAQMHLDSGEQGTLPTVGNARLVWFLFILAVLILMIAWINYVNLSTAQAIRKAHGVSVRKVIGARRGHLIRQQLIETFVLTATSTGLAIAGCLVLQPFFNYLVDLPLSLSTLLNWKFIGGILIFLLLTSFVAGFYVAFVLTGFDPSKVLKGSFARSQKGILVRKTLVTAQFGITIAFIAGTAFMLMQVKYLQNKDVGLAMESRLAISGPGSFESGWIQSRDAFAEEVRQLPSVKNFTASGGNPGQGGNMSVFLSKDRAGVAQERGIIGVGEDITPIIFIDESFIDVFDIEILAGDPPTEKMVRQGFWGNKKMVLNRTAIEQLGFNSPEEAAHQFVYFNSNGTIQEVEILAVIENYHQYSLHSEISSLALAPSLNQVWFTLELEGEGSSEQIAAVEQVYKSHFPKSPFIYQFMDDYYQSFYEEDQRLSQLVTVGALLAIFISCLGLLGLVAHTVTQRAKEISIRKVLGASVGHIVALISKEFIALIVFAVFLAFPVAYYVMDKWLADFAYRIELQWWVFALSGLAAVGIALLTVSVQSVKAALANPVNSLRSE